MCALSVVEDEDRWRNWRPFFAVSDVDDFFFDFFSRPVSASRSLPSLRLPLNRRGAQGATPWSSGASSNASRLHGSGSSISAPAEEGTLWGDVLRGKETARRLRRRKGLPIESCDLSNRRKYRQTPPKNSTHQGGPLTCKRSHEEYTKNPVRRCPSLLLARCS